jgi:hypothetical protein
MRQPMHQFETFQLVLWILAPVGQLIAVAVMYSRKLIREVPWFFAYTVFHLVQFTVLFLSYHYSYSAYFYSYWVAEGIDALLVLIVIQEVYDHVFHPYDALRNLSTILFRWAAIVLLAVTILVAASASGTEQNRFIAGLLILDRSASFVQCGLIFLLFILKQALGLPWRSVNHGVALGLGIISASASITLTMRAYSHQEFDGIFGLVLTITYDLAILTWIAILLRPEPTPDRANVLANGTLQRWDTALLELMNR